ncbi:MAG: methyltransferase domain-containing protein, partial [Treponema sp.]|nr:methyltransferase domain-containing protein [Treponema sp.]
LGAFEAVYARVPVLLLSPTKYHERLARNAGFLTLNNNNFQPQRTRSTQRINSIPYIFLRVLRALRGYKNSVVIASIDYAFLTALELRRREIANRFGLEEDQLEDLGSFISRLAPWSPRNCPVCDTVIGAGAPVLARFPEETFRRCPRCGSIYLSRLTPPPIEYEKDYFFGFYKKQYGKTYLEDFPNLKEMARKRMRWIVKFLSRSTQSTQGSQRSAVEKPSVLDIGCAYGPFLAAAAECGFIPNGVEPAEDAVRYAKEELGFSCWHGFFPEALPEAENRPDRFDAVSLWYVIEHFEEPGKVFAEIHRLLKEGGVLAFSTPSFSGISGRKSLRGFLQNSPQDHWTVWSPRLCKGIFRQYGFNLRKIVVSGHHPERFPIVGRFVNLSKKGTLYHTLHLISRLFRLGDTFEAYGVKMQPNGIQDR